jgi:hypothetical protein
MPNNKRPWYKHQSLGELKDTSCLIEHASSYRRLAKPVEKGIKKINTKYEMWDLNACDNSHSQMNFTSV